jgi:pimeloyl-ACP methyl ester carboxylesterase
MRTVTSHDGTCIAFDQAGQGPAVILVAGALGVRSGPDVGLAALLAPHFTVIDYDRRGRGDSGDTPPYAVDREIEDIAALVDAAGGSAYLYGISSGAVLALEATRTLGAKVRKLALYEPPFVIDASRPPLPPDYVEQINAAVAAGRRGEAVDIFLTQALLFPDEYLAPMHANPSWPKWAQVAHTLAYDGAIVRDVTVGKPLPRERWASVLTPTLVMSGEHSEPFFHDGAQALVDILPHGQRRIVAGQDHAIAAEALAPVLAEFFNASSSAVNQLSASEHA